MPEQPDPRWRNVDVGGALVEVYELGSGDPVLFLPGWGLTARAYATALERVVHGGFRVVAPSLPGFGASTPVGLRAPLEEYARHVIALLDVLDPERPVFATGHSFGGGVTLKVAHLRPDLIRSVTVVNPVGGAPDTRGLRRASWLGWSLATAVSALPRSRPHVLDARQAARLVLDFLPNVARRPLRCAASGALALTAGLADEARQLAEIGMPVLYVWGDRDRLILPGNLHGVGGPDASEIVSGGHGWVITHPHKFAATLHETLAVHALIEREIRGEPEAQAISLVADAMADPERPLAEAFPPERRRRARHQPRSDPDLVSAHLRPMGRR